jgi:hypothetical protein
MLFTLWQLKWIHSVYKESDHTSQRTHCVAFKKNNQWLSYTEIVAVYCKNHISHKNTLCGQKLSAYYQNQ